MAGTIHNPSNFNPQDYDVLDYFDNQPPKPPIDVLCSIPKEEWDRMIAFWEQEVREWRAQLQGYLGEGWGGKIQHCVHCDHSGHMRYIAIVRHIPTNTNVVFGHQCVERCSLPDTKAFRLKYILDKAGLEARQEAKAKAYNDFVEAHEGLADLLTFDHPITQDIKRKLYEYGSISEKQIELLGRLPIQQKEREAAKIAEAQEPKVPVIEGRISIKGTVLSFRIEEGQYGTTTKMLVKDDRGFKVWGTCPRMSEVMKGDLIEFTATVTKSDKDECFGFFKRPSLKRNAA